MSTESSFDKANRILSLYSKLMNGALINKAQEAQSFGVNERTIQRDIDDIRNFLEQEAVEQGIINEIVYDRFNKGYRLEHLYNVKLSNDEILAVCKMRCPGGLCYGWLFSDAFTVCICGL